MPNQFRLAVTKGTGKHKYDKIQNLLVAELQHVQTKTNVTVNNHCQSLNYKLISYLTRESGLTTRHQTKT